MAQEYYYAVAREFRVVVRALLYCCYCRLYQLVTLLDHSYADPRVARVVARALLHGFLDVGGPSALYYAVAREFRVVAMVLWLLGQWYAFS